MPEQIRTWC